MIEIIDFLGKSPAFFVATAGTDGMPRVRPFSLIYEWNGKLSLATGTEKEVYKQLKENPRVEICSYDSDGSRWMRIHGEIEWVDDIGAKREVFKVMPQLKNIYRDENNPVLVCFSIVRGQADYYDFTKIGAVRTVEL